MKRTNQHLIDRHPDNVQGLILESDDRDVCDSIFPQLSAIPPTYNNDSIDSAGIGQQFGPGSRWFDFNLLQLWICVDGTPTAAIWLLATPDVSGILASAEAYADAGDASTLANAEAYADAGDTNVLTLSPPGARTPTAHATSHQPGGSDPMQVDAAAATGSLRTLGTSSTQAAAGNDSRLSDSRTPTGSAGGDLTGTYPDPTLAAVGTPGTYEKVTTDSKGRVTSGGSLAQGDIPEGFVYNSYNFRDKMYDFDRAGEYTVAGSGSSTFSIAVFSTGNGANEVGVAGTYYVMRLHTSTSTTGGCFLRQNLSGATGNWIKNFTGSSIYDLEEYWYTDNISDGTNTYKAYFGFSDTLGTPFTEGVWAEYTHSANSGAWILKYNTTSGTHSGSSNGTGVTIAANTLYRLRLVVTNNTATLYENGVSVATLSGTFTATQVIPMAGILKSAGATQRNKFVDYFRIRYTP